jgi:YidC/Oxa1 family membrane protein insertase
LNYSVYLGPRLKELFHTEPYRHAGLSELLRYNLGGPCAFCTFQWLAHILLAVLKFFDGLTGDWAVSIILLVLVVRLILHPITKQSQVNMAKMGKQMQALQPELEKIKQKYEHDKQKMKEEQARLFQEKGVNPLNMLGCLPMFLQMPIWIALYAMLYFAIELKQEPAFYGLFQGLGLTHFLSDLSRPDRLMVFLDHSRSVTLLFIQFDYSSFNILPLFMGVFWFYQQKYMTPPPPENPTPQQEQQIAQQKVMRYMMLVFPVFLYAAPSGLTLYMMASSAAGLVDSLIVKRHIKREEEAGTLFQKKPPRPGGFRDRLMKALEARRAELEAREQLLRGAEKGAGSTPKRKRR